MMEKQRVVIDELKTKLDLNMDNFDKLRYCRCEWHIEEIYWTQKKLLWYKNFLWSIVLRLFNMIFPLFSTEDLKNVVDHAIGQVSNTECG